MRRALPALALLAIAGAAPAAEAPKPVVKTAAEAPKPAAPRGPGGDPLPTAAAGDPLGKVELTLMPNMLTVDAAPKTLDRPLATAPADGIDISALPAGEWLHGAAPLTKTESVPFAVSMDRKTLFFDADRDGKLEATERAASDSVYANFAWFPAHALVRQEFEGKKHEQDTPLKIGVSLNAPQMRSRLDCYRAGTFVGPTRKIRIAIEDRSFRGWFTHPGVDAILVDIDGNGAFDSTPDSTERYRLGEPFPLDGFDAVVQSIAPLGTSVTLAKSVKPARRIVNLHMGAAAPEFEVHSIDGKTWKLADQRGKWVLLDFWATWCGPCRDELPNIKRAKAEHADLVVLGLSADRARAALDQFIAAQKIDWPQVYEEAQGVLRTYRVASFPTSFLIDPDGNIAARDLRGTVSEQIARLKAARQQGAAKPAPVKPPAAGAARSK